jgi:23S rRNA pseudouridine1911/1915/1917 synthase
MNDNRVEAQRQPLLHWLLQRHPDTPKTRAKQWILAGRVSVGETILRKPHLSIPDPGPALRLLDRHATRVDCGSCWQIHPQVGLLFLDSCLAVVNKAAGLLSVPAPGCELSALSILSDFLAGRLKAQDRGVLGRSLPPSYRKLQPLPVHRLDQHTSGVFCMAINPSARHHLIEQLKAHTMRREYIAFVEGRPSTPSGTWRQWLELSTDELRQRILPTASDVSSAPRAQEAITHFEVIAEYPRAGANGFVTQLRLRLETGRKHQIRVQAAHAGLPLVGDRTYHPGYRDKSRGERFIQFPRQALHAEVLTLEHPEQQGQPMTWRAEWPQDLRQLRAALRSSRL